MVICYTDSFIYYCSKSEEYGFYYKTTIFVLRVKKNSVSLLRHLINNEENGSYNF